MPGPYDYITPLATQLPQPQEGAAILDGINQGLQMRYAQMQNAYQMQQLQRNLALQQQADTARQAYAANPNATTLQQWYAAQPEAFQAINGAHAAMSEDTQRQNVQDMTAGYGYARAGNYDGLEGLLQRRVDAGQENLQPLLAQVQAARASGDPNALKPIQGIMGALLAGAVGPDKAGDVLKSFGDQGQAQQEAVTQGQRVENATKSILQVAPGTQLVPVTPDQSGQGGSPQTSQPVGGAPAQPTQGQPQANLGAAGGQMASAARAAGASDGMVNHLGATAILESSGNASAKNGSSKGLFQFQGPAWAESGGGDINNVGDQTRNALRLAQKNALQLQHSLGQAPTNAQVYLAHQQGATGAAALINADPNMPAWQALAKAGVSEGKAKASIVRNGGSLDMTAGQFVDLWRNRYNDAYAAYTGQGAQQGAQPNGQQGGQPGGYPAAGGQQGQHYGAPGQGFTLGAPIGGSTGMPDQATIDQAAEDWIRTGKTPNDGTRPEGIAINNAVMARGNQLMQQRGISPGQLSAMRTRWQSADTNFSALQGQQGQMEVQEGTVQNGLSIARDLLKNGAGGVSGAKIANTAFGAWRRTMGDDPRTNQLDMALTTAADEYSKILIGNGASTDSARKSAEKMFSSDLPVGKILGNLAFVQQEIAGRKRSGEEQLRYYNAVRISPSAEAPPAAKIAALRAAAKAGGPQAAAAAQTFDQTYGRGMAQNYLGEM